MVCSFLPSSQVSSYGGGLTTSGLINVKWADQCVVVAPVGVVATLIVGCCGGLSGEAVIDGLSDGARKTDATGQSCKFVAIGQRVCY